MNKEDLESATGVSARNVRYLVSEGILPPPEGNGRSARYTAEHLRILRIYSEAKAEGVSSLEVIRRRVAAEQPIQGPQAGMAIQRQVMDGLAVLIDPDKLTGIAMDDILAAVRRSIETAINVKKD